MSTQKIFGLGFPKTGTTTLERAHEILGYTVCKGHWNNSHTNYLLGLYINNDIDGILRLTQHFDAFFDAPWGGGTLYRDLAESYPDAKFILSIRPVDAWFKSLVDSLERVVGEVDDLFSAIHETGRYGPARFYEAILGLKHFREDPDKVKQTYNETNTRVREYMKTKGLDFLELDVTAGDGWQPLCKFLGVPVPERSFPHANPGRQTQPQQRNLTLAEALNLARQHYANGRWRAAENVCMQILKAVPDQEEAQALLRVVGKGT